MLTYPECTFISFQRMWIVPVREQVKGYRSAKQHQVKNPMVQRQMQDEVVFDGKGNGGNTIETI